MVRLPLVRLLILCMLILAIPGLSACSADEDSESEGTNQETAAETEAEPETAVSEDPLVASWESADAYYFASFTLYADGTGTGFETEDSEVDITWTFEDDYLEFEWGSGSMLGGGLMWMDEGAEFSWDAGGTYMRADLAGTSEEPAEEASEGTVSGDIIGIWENPDGDIVYLEVNADGTGFSRDIDGDETDLTWMYEQDYLEITTPDGMSSVGGGVAWIDGSTWEWDWMGGEFVPAP